MTAHSKSKDQGDSKAGQLIHRGQCPCVIISGQQRDAWTGLRANISRRKPAAVSDWPAAAACLGLGEALAASRLGGLQGGEADGNMEEDGLGGRRCRWALTGGKTGSHCRRHDEVSVEATTQRLFASHRQCFQVSSLAPEGSFYESIGAAATRDSMSGAWT